MNRVYHKINLYVLDKRFIASQDVESFVKYVSIHIFLLYIYLNLEKIIENTKIF